MVAKVPQGQGCAGQVSSHPLPPGGWSPGLPQGTLAGGRTWQEVAPGLLGMPGAGARGRTGRQARRARGHALFPPRPAAGPGRSLLTVSGLRPDCWAGLPGPVCCPAGCRLDGLGRGEQASSAFCFCSCCASKTPFQGSIQNRVPPLCGVAIRAKASCMSAPAVQLPATVFQHAVRSLAKAVGYAVRG